MKRALGRWVLRAGVGAALAALSCNWWGGGGSPQYPKPVLIAKSDSKSYYLPAWGNNGKVFFKSGNSIYEASMGDSGNEKVIATGSFTGLVISPDRSLLVTANWANPNYFYTINTSTYELDSFSVSVPHENNPYFRFTKSGTIWYMVSNTWLNQELYRADTATGVSVFVMDSLKIPFDIDQSETLVAFVCRRGTGIPVNDTLCLFNVNDSSRTFYPLVDKRWEVVLSPIGDGWACVANYDHLKYELLFFNYFSGKSVTQFLDPPYWASTLNGMLNWSPDGDRLAFVIRSAEGEGPHYQEIWALTNVEEFLQ